MAPPAVPASAKQIVTDFLNQYGLSSLANWAWGIYTSAGGGTTGISAITAELPNTAQFKARFPAYETLAKQGHAMSIQQMLDYENTARQVMHAAGLPPDFYNQPDDFAKFMVAGVGLPELEGRVKDAQQAMLASPDIVSQLDRLYGIDAGHMTAFFLDPNQAEPLIMQKYTASQIAAQSQRAGVGQLSVEQAGALAQQGVTDTQAQQGFTQLGQTQGLFQAQTTGEQTIGLNEQLAGTFGGEGSGTALTEFQRRQAQRKAQFQESSGFNVSQAGVGGLGPAQHGS